MNGWKPYHFVKETTIYGYNGSKNLISITSKDDNGNVLRFSELTINENGDPVLLVSYDEAGRPFEKETATYIYDQNKVVTSVISNSGRVLSSDTLKSVLINQVYFQMTKNITMPMAIW